MRNPSDALDPWRPVRSLGSKVCEENHIRRMSGLTSPGRYVQCEFVSILATALGGDHVATARAQLGAPGAMDRSADRLSLFVKNVAWDADKEWGKGV